MPVNVPLSKPIQSGSGEIKEITLRELTARDLVKMRKPFNKTTIGAGGEITIEADFETAMQYLSELSGHDDITLGLLCAADFIACCRAMDGLFTSDEAKN